jgi:NADPH-dependent ferric siderophore reductase
MGTPSAGAIRRSPIRTGRVIGTAVLTARMRRVTVQADAMRGVPVRPAQDVELLLRAPDGRRVKRRYTIRHARPDRGELDLDVVLHGDGPGARWGESARPGDPIEFQGPRGKLELRRAPWHLLCGDESALPAIAAIAEALPPDEHGLAVIEVRDAADEQPVPLDARWVHRGGEHPPGTPELLVSALAEAALPAPAKTHAYLLGETRSMVALRALLEGRGVPHDAIFVKGYWNIARPDRVTGQSPTR